MDYYDISCELDKIHSKIECFAEMMGTLASAESDNGASGTFWFIHDVARGYAKDLEALSHQAMEQHRPSFPTIQESPTEGNYTREEVLTAIKKAKKKGKK